MTHTPCMMKAVSGGELKLVVGRFQLPSLVWMRPNAWAANSMRSATRALLKWRDCGRMLAVRNPVILVGLIENLAVDVAINRLIQTIHFRPGQGGNNGELRRGGEEIPSSHFCERKASRACFIMGP